MRIITIIVLMVMAAITIAIMYALVTGQLSGLFTDTSGLLDQGESKLSGLATYLKSLN